MPPLRKVAIDISVSTPGLDPDADTGNTEETAREMQKYQEEAHRDLQLARTASISAAKLFLASPNNILVLPR